jgi:predicted outer membrane repeat protein
MYICVAGTALALAAPAGAATITVTETDDNGGGTGCELREAVRSANDANPEAGCATTGTAGADVIAFSLSTPATISLISALPDIPAGQVLTVGGPSADPEDVVIQQTNGNARIFNTAANLTVTNVALKGGGLFGDGGAINSSASVSVTDTLFEGNRDNTFTGGCIRAATITATDSTFDNNQANTGGCLAADTITVTDSTFTSNDAQFGGAIAPGDQLTVNGGAFGGPSVAQGNVATAGGGAISTALDGSASFSIDDATFRNNQVTSGPGGAIQHDGLGDVTVNDSSFTSNTATGDGGAIEHTGGNLGLSSSTFFLNSSDTSGGAVHIGTATGQNSVVNSTFRSNSADVNGGSVTAEDDVELLHDSFVDNASGTGDVVDAATATVVTLASSIVADTAATAGTNCSGALIDGGYNVISGDEAGSTCPTSGTNVTGNPGIGPLGPFGGPTSTVLLTSPSAAVDLIPNLDCSESDDQRGAARPTPVGGRCDAGAAEVDFLPDGKIGKAGQATTTGADIYNEDGDGQAMTLRVKPGKKASFGLSFESDAQLLTDGFTITGPGSSRKFSVRYKAGTDDVTAEVTGAGYETSTLGPGGSEGLVAAVKPKRSTTNGKLRLNVTASSLQYDDRSDTVSAVTRVK